MNDALKTALRPIWTGDTVADESVLFLETERAASLTFPADEILRVRAPDGTAYEPGRDYALSAGRLTRPAGSRLPFIPLDRFYPPKHTEGQDFACAVPGHALLGFGESDAIIRYTVLVTYRHSAPWTGPVPPSQAHKCARFLEKLHRGKEATLLFYGDSITTGANSSGVVGAPPFLPSFPEMTAAALAEKYGYALTVDVRPYEEPKPVRLSGEKRLHYVNTAVGGTDSVWGLQNVEPRVNAFHPDLLVLAFGMNDGGKTRGEYLSLTAQIVDAVTRATPDADILLLSTMLPHRRAADFWGHQDEFEEELRRFAENEPHIGLAPMTSVHRHLLAWKEFYHATGNNINHPNDFLARVYAMTLLAALGAK